VNWKGFGTIASGNKSDNGMNTVWWLYVIFFIALYINEVTGKRGRKRRKLLDDLQERRGYSHLKEKALDRTMWTARFGRGFRPVVRQTAK
jgi:hypothetical protein